MGVHSRIHFRLVTSINNAPSLFFLNSIFRYPISRAVSNVNLATSKYCECSLATCRHVSRAAKEVKYSKRVAWAETGVCSKPWHYLLKLSPLTSASPCYNLHTPPFSVFGNTHQWVLHYVCYLMLSLQDFSLPASSSSALNCFL